MLENNCIHEYFITKYYFLSSDYQILHDFFKDKNFVIEIISLSIFHLHEMISLLDDSIKSKYLLMNNNGEINDTNW